MAAGARRPGVASRIPQDASEDEQERDTGDSRCRPRRRRRGGSRLAHERAIVNGVVRRATAQSCGELQPCRRRALQEDAGRRIRPFEALEGADERMRRVADAVAVEVEARYRLQ